MKIKNILAYIGLFFLLGAPVFIAFAISLITGETYYISTSTTDHSSYGKHVLAT